MNINDLKSHKGNIISLDLVNGITITTKILDVSEERDQVQCSKIIVFTVNAMVKNPNLPPHPVTNPVEGRVSNMAYGAPLYKEMDSRWIDAAHIIMDHYITPDMSQAYITATSSITPAGAGALSGIPDAKTLFGKKD